MFSTTRRTLLGAAATLPLAALPALAPPVIAGSEETKKSNPAATLWNRRLATYRRLAARWQTEGATGAYAAANEKYNRAYNELSARFGSWMEAIRSPIGEPLCRAAFAPVKVAKDAYYNDFTGPMHRAAIRLALTPAPDLPALLEKIRVIKDQELDEAASMTRPAMEVLAEDVARLSVLA